MEGEGSKTTKWQLAVLVAFFSAIEWSDAALPEVSDTFVRLPQPKTVEFGFDMNTRK